MNRRLNRLLLYGVLVLGAVVFTIPLIWMLDKLESSGLALPEGWHLLFPVEADAPSVGTWRGWGKYFVARKKRLVGEDASEAIHPTAIGRSRRAGDLGAPVTP